MLADGGTQVPHIEDKVEIMRLGNLDIFVLLAYLEKATRVGCHMVAYGFLSVADETPHQCKLPTNEYYAHIYHVITNKNQEARRQ